MLPQIHTAPSDFRVKELVGYGRMPHQKLMAGKSKEDEEVIRWAMEVTGTWKFRDKSIYEISGGETQRVWIATGTCAEAGNPCFWMSQRPIWTFSHQLENDESGEKIKSRDGNRCGYGAHDWRRRWKSAIMDDCDP